MVVRNCVSVSAWEGLLESLSFRDVWISFSNSFLKPATTIISGWAFVAIGLKVKLSTSKKIAVIAGMISLLLVMYLWLPFSGN